MAQSKVTEQQQQQQHLMEQASQSPLNHHNIDRGTINQPSDGEFTNEFGYEQNGLTLLSTQHDNFENVQFESLNDTYGYSIQNFDS